jgi:phosphoserine phosphatase RsbU/P
MAVLRDLKADKVYPLQGKITVIGRDPACDIVVRTGQTSARHAMVVQSGGAYAIEDLDSVNGTYVNGRRIRERTPLKPNDRVELHGLATVFLPEDGEGPPANALPDTEQMTAITSSLDVGGLRVEVAAETKLRAVLEIAKNLGASLDLKEVLPKILESLFAIFPQADRGFILLRDADTGQLVPRAVRHRREPPGDPLALSRTVLNAAVKTGRAILSADAATDERFDLSQSIQSLQLRSVMCVPLVGPTGASLGAIQIDTRDRRHPFREEDLDVLVSAAAQAARAVELARLHQERRDLEAATQIQKSFLPGERPRVPQLRFFDYYSPAQHIGGDYYDYIPLPGNRLAVALGDVSGKGVAAALLMARLSAAARFCLAAEPSVPEAVRQLNLSLQRVAGGAGRFVTFVVAVLDLKDFTLTLVNAGHLPPLRRAGAGSVEALAEDVVGLPLAVADRPYKHLVLPLEPGDTLVLYTDGVTEARNATGGFYETDRLRRLVAKGAKDVDALGKAIVADVRRFAGDRPQSDDLTVVCLERELRQA